MKKRIIILIVVIFQILLLSQISFSTINTFADTSISDKLSKNIKDYGAKGDGKSDDSKAFVKYINAIGDYDAELYIQKGTYRISNNLTIPENLNMNFTSGAVLQVDKGITVKINGRIIAGEYMIFSGYGDITGFGSVKELYIQWWGIKGNDSLDDSKKIVKLINSLGSTESILNIPDGKFKISSQITIPQSIHLILGDNTVFDVNDGVVLKISGEILAGKLNQVGLGKIDIDDKKQVSIWDWSSYVNYMGTKNEDWTPAIQKAIEYSQQSGYEIYFPPNYVYNVKGHITIPKRIDGYTSFIPTLVGNGKGMYSPNKNYGTVNSSKIVTWQTDYTFSEDNKDGGICMNLFGLYFISNNQWTKSIGNLFKDKLFYSEIRDCCFTAYDTVFTNGLGLADKIENNSALRIHCFLAKGGGDSQIRDNFFSANTDSDSTIAIDYTDGPGSESSITDNWFEFFTTGLKAYGTLNMIISRNTFDYCHNSLMISGYNYSVIGNSFTHCRKIYADNTALFSKASDILKKNTWTAITLNYTKGGSIIGNFSDGADLFFFINSSTYSDLTIVGNNNMDGFTKNINGTMLYYIDSYLVCDNKNPNRWYDFDNQVYDRLPDNHQKYPGQKFYYKNKLINTVCEADGKPYKYYDTLGNDVTNEIRN